MHAEFGVERFQVFLVKLENILDVEYLHRHEHNTLHLAAAP